MTTTTTERPFYLIDCEDEPATIWVTGHHTTPEARLAKLREVIEDWQGLTEWFEHCEVTADKIAARNPALCWQRPDTQISDADRQACENLYGKEWEPWTPCDEGDEGAQPFTALRVYE